MYALTKMTDLFAIGASLLWVMNQELQMIYALMEQLDAQVPNLELLSSAR